MRQGTRALAWQISCPDQAVPDVGAQRAKARPISWQERLEIVYLKKNPTSCNNMLFISNRTATTQSRKKNTGRLLASLFWSLGLGLCKERKREKKGEKYRKIMLCKCERHEGRIARNPGLGMHFVHKEETSSNKSNVKQTRHFALLSTSKSKFHALLLHARCIDVQW